jgi:hypothetical protein
METNLGNRCSKDNNFIKLADALHELINTGTLDDIYIMILTLNLNWNGEIGLVEDLLWEH